MIETEDQRKVKRADMGREAEEENTDLTSSLIHRGDSSMDFLERTGTKWTAVAHIVTGVAGVGVLSLAWSVAQLGWFFGPLSIILFAAMTLFSSFLLAECYRHPDPEYGHIRNRSFMEATKLYLGKKHQLIMAVMVQVALYGLAINFTSTAASSVRAILKSDCYHRGGHDARCEYQDYPYMILFGFVQILLSQIPNFHSTRWISMMALVMSLCFSFIATGLGLVKVIENGTIKGSGTGVQEANLSTKLFVVFTALGDIAFSFPFTLILFEIQDTLKSPPPENKTMKAAAAIAVPIIMFFFLCCGCFGYAAFGDATPGNLLSGFGFYEPYWLVDFANACVILYLVGAYQIYCQASFPAVEGWFAEKFPNSRFLDKSYSIKLPFSSVLRTNRFQLCYRTFYAMSATALAIIIPYFNSVLGVLGAVNFWPISVYFPVQMYCAQKKIKAWSREWILLTAFSVFGFAITVVGTIGSVEELIQDRLGG